MNFDQAKAMALTVILEKLGFQPTKEDNTDATYFSPFRDEKTPSFHVNKQDNVWFDHGEGIGGGNIEFVCKHLEESGEDHTREDARRWCSNMFNANLVFSKKPTEKTKEPGWKLIQWQHLDDPALILYLKRRGIDVALAKKHVVEVNVKSLKTDKKYYALGFKNDDGGYEIRNSFIKSCIAPKTITFILGSSSEKPKVIHFFEGFMDYLTFLTLRKGQHKGDVIVLNSVNCIEQAIGYINNFDYYQIASTWMDNDKKGDQATNKLAEFFKTQKNLTHIKRNRLYADHKDLNAWHMHDLNLKL